jgi:hypothetical protein
MLLATPAAAGVASFLIGLTFHTYERPPNTRLFVSFAAGGGGEGGRPGFFQLYFFYG